MIRLKVGFDKNQFYEIPFSEAHKAYYLFFNPEERGVFRDGTAVVGKCILAIEPDSYPWVGDSYLRMLDIVNFAKEVALKGDPKDISRPLEEVRKERLQTIPNNKQLNEPNGK